MEMLLHPFAGIYRYSILRFFSVIEVGDFVRYCEADDLGRVVTVQITVGTSRTDKGIIKHKTPVAQALLRRRVDEVTMVHLPLETNDIIVLKIHVG
jgi:transcription elongation GreA/GreB family factor